MSLKGKAYCFFLLVFCFTVQYSSAQNQKLADSLSKIYKEGKLKDLAKLNLLKSLSFNEVNDLKLAIKYANELIQLSNLQGNNIYLHNGYFQRGNKKRLLGNLDEALQDYFMCVKVSRNAHLMESEGIDYGAIADIYSVSNNHLNAMLYYRKAISILRQSKDSIALASVILNAGDALRINKNYHSALLYFKESGKIFEKANYLIGKAYSLGNIGMVYASMGQNDSAEKKINEAIPILEKLEDYYPICVYLISMSDIYLAKGDKNTAVEYALRSLNLAKKYGLKEQIGDANLKLSELNEKTGNLRKSLKYYKNHIAYRDSVNNIKSVQKMADLRTDFEVSQKQAEVDLLNQQRQNQRSMVVSLFIILGLTTVLLVTLYCYYRTIANEKKRSESLLLNILPTETAKELKRNGKVIAVKFEQISVLFTDFVEFTKSAELIDPEQLVKSIDYYFKGFDEITTKYGLEKIKTVGDSYMCASGLPTASPSHTKNMIRAAKEMIELVRNELSSPDGLCHFEVRIGVNTGPVVAGIVGIKKWQYDIWGDTVNIASRMESMSKPGRINLSETTYNEIKDEFICEYRGEIEVKNRGQLKMYFLM